MAAWGVPAYDTGHLKHREIAGLQICRVNTDGGVPRTSNSMEHGTLAVKIRQEDYRSYLVTLYAVVCYPVYSGNQYSPEDAVSLAAIQESIDLWLVCRYQQHAAPAYGLRWLLCYEENDRSPIHNSSIGIIAADRVIIPTAVRLERHIWKCRCPAHSNLVLSGFAVFPTAASPEEISRFKELQEGNWRREGDSNPR